MNGIEQLLDNIKELMQQEIDTAYLRGKADGEAGIREKLSNLFDVAPAKSLERPAAPKTVPERIIPELVPVDAATLRPLTPLQYKALAALKSILEDGATYTTAKVNQLAGTASAAGALSSIRDKGYIRNIARGGPPSWEITYFGEPRVEDARTTARAVEAPSGSHFVPEPAPEPELPECLRRTSPAPEVMEAHAKLHAPARPPESLPAASDDEEEEEESRPRAMTVPSRETMQAVGDYLRGKSVQVRVIGIGRFQVRGEFMDHDDLLEFANGLRKEDGLAPFGEKESA